MEEPDREVFGPLVDIPVESLTLLASKIASQHLHVSGSDCRLAARISGSFNIVHIIELGSVRLVIRVPATGWGSGMTSTAAHAMESQAATMRLIRSKTMIPVPEIYALDTTDNNEIGAPYLCMSFMPGKPVSEVWFGHLGALPQDELRLRILQSLSRTMAQLSCLSFDKIGSIMEDESGSTIVGPLYGWHDGEDGCLQVVASGPFDSTSAFLKKHLILKPDGNEWDRAEAKVLTAALDCLLTCDTQPGFVLCHPDFDSQNVLVDDNGGITGLIDWDLAETMPRFVGYARYPGWITRDWDPVKYHWPKAELENSPASLERYRAYYNREIGKALNMQCDWRFTEKSHIAEAIWIAVRQPTNRTAICRKLVEVAAGEDDFYHIGMGYYGEDQWKNLKVNLKRLIS